MIALISNYYLRSKVCVEEFSLAVALQLQGTSKVWPLVIESLDENMEWLHLLSPVECFIETSEKGNFTLSSVFKSILRDIRGGFFVIHEYFFWKIFEKLFPCFS